MITAVGATSMSIVKEKERGTMEQVRMAPMSTTAFIAGKTLPFGNREILFDGDGKEAAAGTLTGEFRRPSWLKSV